MMVATMPNGPKQMRVTLLEEPLRPFDRSKN